MKPKEELQRKVNNFLRQAEEEQGKKPTRPYIMDADEKRTLALIKKRMGSVSDRRRMCIQNNVDAAIERLA